MGLPRLSGAVRFNLLWAGRIAKEQWLGESPGRLAFPACLACRQPLFVLLALFSPLHTPTQPPTPTGSPAPLWKKKTHNGGHLPVCVSRGGYKQKRSWLGRGWKGKRREVIDKQTEADGDWASKYTEKARRRKRGENIEAREEENDEKKQSQTKHNLGICKENNGSKLSYCLVLAGVDAQ